MEQTHVAKYERVSLIGLGVLIILFWGFYRTYIVFFPAFEGFQFIQHFHGVLMLLWMALLIIQPWLIARKKLRIHKLIGKVSFVIAPLLIISIFLVSQMTFHRNLSQDVPMSDAIAEIALNIGSLLVFIILYALAVLNTKRTFYHMRYMIGTALLMIGPGLGRALIIYFEMPPPIAISVTLGAEALMGVALFVSDLVKKRDYRPFLIVACVLILEAVIWEARYTGAWQVVGGLIAKLY
jgi:hypothetical protein